MKRLLMGLICLTMLATFPACNTVRGVGQDIKKGGEAIENAAKKATS